MKKGFSKKLVLLTLLFLLTAFLCSCKKKDVDDIPNENIPQDNQDSQDNIDSLDDKDEKPEPKNTDIVENTYELTILDEGEIIFYSSEGFYRYGPSIVDNGDGSMDMWLSSPGNSGSQWDWIAYRRSDNGTEWPNESIVLRPSPGSKDQCSVCDPAIIYFNGYYYLGYTATDYYEGKGSYNMAYVARSRYPDGPFEKWNGSGWGGNPEPIIFYDGGQDNWGIGELSFVIFDGDLCIYYTYIDVADRYVGLYKADLIDDWPGTMRNKGPVLYRLDQDSTEVVFDDYLNLFMAFTVDGRMMEGSNLKMYVSKNGKDFEEVASTKEYFEDYAHNLGVAKSLEGHIDSSKDLLIGYAYGKTWGRWNTKLQHVKVSKN